MQSNIKDALTITKNKFVEFAVIEENINMLLSLKRINFNYNQLI